MNAATGASGTAFGHADFKLVFNAAPSLCLVLAADGPRFTIVAATDAYLLAGGKRRDDLLGRSLSEIFSDNPDIHGSCALQDTLASLERTINLRIPDSIVLLRHDSARSESEGCGFGVRHWRALNTPVINANGDVAYFLHQVEDVTGLVHLQNEMQHDGSALGALSTVQCIGESRGVMQVLRESQRFLRASLNALSGHVAVLDAAGTVLEINEAWRRFAQENNSTGAGVGVNYFEVCEKNLGKEDEIPIHIAGIKKVIAGHQPLFEMEYACHTPTRQRWFVMRVTRFQGPGPVRIVIVHNDCTERKLAENAMRESEERYRNLFNAMDEGFCIIDMIFNAQGQPADCRFLEVNPAFSVQTGLRDAVGKRMSDFSSDHDDRWMKVCGEVFKTGEPVRFAHEENKGDTRFDIYAARLDGPENPKVALVINNITERSRLEQASLEQAQALADLHRRKDEFLAMLSHELRNPLAPLLSAVELLRMQENENPLHQQACQVIERQVGQLKHLVDDLLEISRITSGSVRLRREPVSLGDIVERALESVQPLILQRRHRLTVSLPPQPVWLEADATRMEQVLVNLLTNAAKYTDEGGGIWLSAAQENGTAGQALAVLRVRDSGIGIAPELLPHVFDLFTQAERSIDRSQGGMGIGLCLVRRLVELHAGSVEAHSVLGQGSEFMVRLPVLTMAAPQQPVGLPAPASSLRCRVLAVDDSVDAVEFLAMLLRIAGHEVGVAYDGPSVLQAALAMRPDVVLLDIGLPGLTGYEVARQIRQEPTLSHTVLVALTGYGRESDIKRSKNAGFACHLVKPAGLSEVEKILATVLAQRVLPRSAVPPKAPED